MYIHSFPHPICSSPSRIKPLTHPPLPFDFRESTTTLGSPSSDYIAQHTLHTLPPISYQHPTPTTIKPHYLILPSALLYSTLHLHHHHKRSSLPIRKYLPITCNFSSAPKDRTKVDLNNYNLTFNRKPRLCITDFCLFCLGTYLVYDCFEGY